MKICTEFGEGFFYIPGTDTCLRIQGEIRADYRFFEYDHRRDDAYDFTTEARVMFDARTQTEYGLLRSFFQLDARAGNSHGAGDHGFDYVIDKAFLQFGGLTAGYAHSFFGFYDNEYGDTVFASYYTQFKTVNLLAYTAAFGGGFTATASLEDGGEQNGSGTFDSDVGFFRADGDPVHPGYGGKRMPDVVANLRLDQEWGKASVQGAVHQVRYPFAVNDEDYGWALGASVAVNLPFLPGSYVVVEGAYANGAMSYVGLGGDDDAPEGNLSRLNGDTDTAHAWSVTGEAGFAVTPQLVLVAFGSYVDYTAADGVGPAGALQATVDDFKQYTVGANATYTITKGLTVAGEVSYTNKDFDHAGNPDDGDSWQGGVRIKRTF